MGRGVTPDYNEVNSWLYSGMSEIMADMVEGQRNGADSSSIALEALDSVEQLLNAIKLDLGAR